MRRWHVHGTKHLADGAEVAITVSCTAPSEEAAQRIAWRACEFDISEIEPEFPDPLSQALNEGDGVYRP